MARLDERSARLGVVFSSGFFGFFAHAGFLAAIRELGISPCAFGGASSGAIVAAMAASGMGDGEIQELLFNLRKRDFWDPDPWHVIFSKALRLFRGYTGYLTGGGFARLLGSLPKRRIEDCEVPLAISATNLNQKKETIFTEGNLIKSVWASGAVPVLFKPVEINGSFYVDGGVSNKAPVKAVADLGSPDKILIHFMVSKNLELGLGPILKQKMAFWHIQHLAGNIARQEAYRRQVEMVRMRGIHVIEVRTQCPFVGPGSLQNGPAAYHASKNQTLRILSESGI